MCRPIPCHRGIHERCCSTLLGGGVTSWSSLSLSRILIFKSMTLGLNRNRPVFLYKDIIVNDLNVLSLILLNACRNSN
jgi:hypothetical protein